jgi:hypothetical protein
MGQEADLTEQGTTPTEDERNRRSGRDIPGGDGSVSDEDVNAISDDHRLPRRKTGQDHSTEDHEKEAPTEGIGAVQNSSDTSSDLAHIED